MEPNFSNICSESPRCAETKTYFLYSPTPSYPPSLLVFIKNLNHKLSETYSDLNQRGVTQKHTARLGNQASPRGSGQQPGLEPGSLHRKSDVTADECQAPQPHSCYQLLAAHSTHWMPQQNFYLYGHHKNGLENPFFISLISSLNPGAGVPDWMSLGHVLLP